MSTMKKVFALSVPCLTFLAFATTACEDSTSGPSIAATPDGGFPGDSSNADGDVPVPSKCPEPTGAPVVHDKNVYADETWGAGLHDVIYDLALHKNATVTIEPCAVVRVAASHGITVGTGNAGDGGKIIAKGKADLPIVFQAKDAGTHWASVLVYPLGYVDLAYVTIKDAGDRASRGGAALHLVGDKTKPIQTLAMVDHVTLEGAVKYGAVLEGHGAFDPASQSVTVKGAGDMAIRAEANTIGTIPTGSYTGNGVDAIRLMGSNDLISADVTIHDRGVPYVVGGDGEFNEMSVSGKDGTEPILTIEAGVVLKFGKNNSGLFVERASTTQPARGALRALGTADKPVVFTSAEATPAAGDWVGIHFRGVPSSKNKIDFARVEYAGGATGTLNFSCGTPMAPVPNKNEAAIAIFGPPASAFVTNTVILKSNTNAFERGWTGAPVEFLATNTFTDIKYCRQTFPRPATGACPDPAPCD